MLYNAPGGRDNLIQIMVAISLREGIDEQLCVNAQAVSSDRLYDIGLIVFEGQATSWHHLLEKGHKHSLMILTDLQENKLLGNHCEELISPQMMDLQECPSWARPAITKKDPSTEERFEAEK